jgi:hypothetical protein
VLPRRATSSTTSRLSVDPTSGLGEGQARFSFIQKRLNILDYSVNVFELDRNRGIDRPEATILYSINIIEKYPAMLSF